MLSPEWVAKKQATSEQLKWVQRARRAMYTHMNALEAFPAYATGVVFAILTNVPTHTIHAAASVFLVSRVAHMLVYIHADSTPASFLRTTFFFGGLGAISTLLGASIAQLL